MDISNGLPANPFGWLFGDGKQTEEEIWEEFERMEKNPFAQALANPDTFGNVPGLIVDAIGNALEGTVIGDALSDVGSAVDNTLTGDRDFNRQKELLGFSQSFNAREAQKQRDWEEKMLSTSTQRTLADLRKAGLSPAYLLAGSATGQHVPSGASASSPVPGYSGSAQAFNGFLNLLGHVALGAISAASNAAIAASNASSYVNSFKNLRPGKYLYVGHR